MLHRGSHPFIPVFGSTSLRNVENDLSSFRMSLKQCVLKTEPPSLAENNTNDR